MMKRVFASIAFIGVLAGCKKDFIVKDITGELITVISPSDNKVTTANLVTFWWEELDGAEKYRLQVVQPTFASLIAVVLDTNLAATKYNLTLPPGNYQWRIRGYNNGGQTVWQTYNLKVDTTSNLSSQLVSNISPLHGFLTGDRSVFFSWNSLSAATIYQITILNSTGGTVKDTITSNTNYIFSFPAVSGAYTWKVRAQNYFSVSPYNVPSTITIDLTAPAPSTPTAPSHGAVVTNTVSLGWTRTGAPDARFDSIYVATDSLFTNVISKAKSYQLFIPVNSLTPPLPANGTTYWWRLRSVDSVGNRSIYSNYLKFKLN